MELVEIVVDSMIESTRINKKRLERKHERQRLKCLKPLSDNVVPFRQMRREKTHSHLHNVLDHNVIKQLFNQSTWPVMIVERDTFKIKNVNEAAVSYYKYPYDDFLKMKITEISCTPISLCSSFFKSPKEAIEFKNRRHMAGDGNILTVDVFGHNIGNGQMLVLIKVLSKHKAKEKKHA